MIKYLDLTIKNFLSVGNCTQGINFDQHDLTLILGENRDQGGNDAGSRNGCGKSTLTHALSYVLFGQALTKIKVDNLVNKLNEKDMLVTLTFSKNGIMYRIERGRKPAIFKFYIDGVSQDDNEAQGESRETQEEINKLLLSDHMMYKNIISLNTYSEPFLSMKAADQRDIIENLLGITILSDKAEILKKQIKDTKDAITKESAIIEANTAANNKIQESINNLITSQKNWANTKDTECNNLAERIKKMQEFDIDTEINNHHLIQKKNQVVEKIHMMDIHISTLESSLKESNKKVKQYELEISKLDSNKCPMCEQGLHSDTHEQLKSKAVSNLNAQLVYMEDVANRLQEEYDNRDHEYSINEDVLQNNTKTVYKSLDDALKHKSNLDNLLTKLEMKFNEVDPYKNQIDELTNKALTEINYDELNELTRLKDHQELLLKLLTNKDSFLRKQIIDQNLSFLNSRLSYNLEKVGLPHNVIFNNDLSVDITYLGRELDFHNLSRGEMTRVSLSLSFAFRDVWESLYQPVNLMIIDELLDAGLDSSGAENAVQLLKNMIYERNKNIFLISHKDDLTSKVTNVLKAIKENSFTSYTYEE